VLINPARPRLTPGVALAAAGVLALTPAVVAPTELPAPPRVQVTDVALAGIGQDIYYAITPVVQEAVGGVSYLVNAVPLIGGPIAAQININYFQGIQPVIEATVNYLAAVVQDPLNFLAATADYGSTLYDIGYNWVSAEAVFFGLPPLPPLPQTAAAGARTAPRTAGAAARPAREARAAARTARPAAAKAAKPAKPAKAAASEAAPGAKKASATARPTRGAAR
jgi:hypothetical protein